MSCANIREKGVQGWNSTSIVPVRISEEPVWQVGNMGGRGIGVGEIQGLAGSESHRAMKAANHKDFIYYLEQDGRREIRSTRLV